MPLAVAAAADEAAPLTDSDPTPVPIPPVWLQKINVGPGRVAVIESTLAEEPVSLAAQNIQVEVADLRANITGQPPAGDHGFLRASGGNYSTGRHSGRPFCDAITNSASR